MEILETQHGYLTAYELMKIVANRNRTNIQNVDGRDAGILTDSARVSQSRMMLFETLLVHSPDGSNENGNDNVKEAIAEFSERIQELVPDITPNQLRNLIAIRPSSPAELASIFSTRSQWETIATKVDHVLSLIEELFPKHV